MGKSDKDMRNSGDELEQTFTDVVTASRTLFFRL